MNIIRNLESNDLSGSLDVLESFENLGNLREM